MDKLFEWPHVICCQQEKFSRQWLENELFPEARGMKAVVSQRGCNVLSGKRIMSMFYQKSTRTRCSFEMAIGYLGGQVAFSTENAREFSSASVGETLRHTILVLNRYRPDAIILRYDGEIGAEIAASVSESPIINAGDRHPKNGEPKSLYSGQHPTQAFLDLFTIHERRGGVDEVSVAMVGDLKNGRTARSLAYLLAKFSGVRIHFVSPPEQRMKGDVLEYLQTKGVSFTEDDSLADVIMNDSPDVYYMLRTQREQGSMVFDLTDKFFLDIVRASRAKKNAIFMHPLPIDSRVKEIRPELENDPRSVFLTDQVDSGLYIRMALLKMILA